MARTNNYLIQAAQAKKRFLTYDQEKLIRKFQLESDAQYIYVNLLCQLYSIDRSSGDLRRQVYGTWVDANTYEEVMTLLDLLCDSRDDRCLCGQWQNMQSFGLQFHQNLLEESRDPFAEKIDANPAWLHRAAARLGAAPIRGGDFGYAFDLFDGLKIGLLFWHGDEEFAPRVRYLWDANARQYIRYETMYFALTLLRRRIRDMNI
ncbi:MAG: DUF3786 domain-containing protein [Oscillospiraceae bacterium]|nr:DUF3786 domain-containing protein [Oscillospiraceae bacterium]